MVFSGIAALWRWIVTTDSAPRLDRRKATAAELNAQVEQLQARTAESRRTGKPLWPKSGD
jgi:hypothetical protein